MPKTNNPIEEGQLLSEVAGGVGRVSKEMQEVAIQMKKAVDAQLEGLLAENKKNFVEQMTVVLNEIATNPEHKVNKNFTPAMVEKATQAAAEAVVKGGINPLNENNAANRELLKAQTVQALQKEGVLSRDNAATTVDNAAETPRPGK